MSGLRNSSSNINEVIKTVLNLFFTKRFYTHQKAQKAQKEHKTQKTQKVPKSTKIIKTQPSKSKKRK